MIRRLPVVPTLLVLVAAGIMIRLGFWQLDRLGEKEALIARYAQVEHQDAMIEWPERAGQVPSRLYNRTRINCRKVLAQRSASGRSRTGVAGLAQIVECELIDPSASVEDDTFRTAQVVLGWSRDPRRIAWEGGEITGTIAPGPRLVADPPLAGLEANALPDPRDIPNNHFAYAVQWFLFAGVALVIYALAVRKRLQGK